MSLIYFHRFLIATAVLFSLSFAWHQFQAWSRQGQALNLVGAIACIGAAVALALYLRTVRMPRGNGG